MGMVKNFHLGASYQGARAGRKAVKIAQQRAEAEANSRARLFEQVEYQSRALRLMSDTLIEIRDLLEERA